MANAEEYGQRWMAQFIELVDLKAKQRDPQTNDPNISGKIDAAKKEMQDILGEINKLNENEQHIALNCTYKKAGPYQGRTPLTVLFNTYPGELPLSDMKTYLASLTRSGADINLLDATGNAPIHYAISVAGATDKNDFFTLLMNESDINVNLPSRKGISPLEMAIIGKFDNVMAPLAKKGAGMELFHSADEIAQSQKGSTTANSPKAESRFQSLYRKPQSGMARAFVIDSANEYARRQQRDGMPPPNPIDNLDKYFNLDKIEALAHKRKENGYPIGVDVYRGICSPEEITEKSKNKRQLEAELSEKVAKREMTEAEKEKQIEPLQNELNDLAKTNLSVATENHRKFSEIAANPTDFLRKTPQEQQDLIESMFLEKYAPKLNELVPVLEERAKFLDNLKAERREVAEITDTVMMGHRFGFTGKYDYEAHGQKRAPVDYEGFSVFNTVLSLSQRFSQFNELVQKSENNFTSAEKNALQVVADSYKSLDRAFDKDQYLEQVQRYKSDLPILIPCHWPAHIANMVLYKDKIYISNRGGGTPTPSIRCYQINPDKLPKDEKELAKFIKTLSTKSRQSDRSDNLDLKELKYLEPKMLYQRRLEGQKQGNCSYTNTKRGADAIMMALKDDAKRLQEKKEQGSSLTSTEEGILQYKDINNKKVFKAFTTYDRKSSINEYIQKHKDSPNKHKWDPLIRYLQTKADGNDERSISLSAHILKKLQSSPINMTQEQIAKEMKNLKYQPTLKDNAVSFGIHLAAGMFKGERHHLAKALSFITPGGRTYLLNQALSSAGMDPKILPRSNIQTMINVLSNPFKKKENTKPKTTTAHEGPKVDLVTSLPKTTQSHIATSHQISKTGAEASLPETKPVAVAIQEKALSSANEKRATPMTFGRRLMIGTAREQHAAEQKRAESGLSDINNATNESKTKIKFQ